MFTRIHCFLLSVFVVLGWQLQARDKVSYEPVHPQDWWKVHVEGSKIAGVDTSTIWFDDFESVTDEWTLKGGWEITTASYSSPAHSVNTDDNYGTIPILISPAISLPDIDEKESIHFGFDLWCDMPDFDGDGDGQLDDYYMMDISDMTESQWHTSSFNAWDGNSWWCGDENLGGYSNEWLQFLDSPEIDIPLQDSTSLTFKLKYALESYSGAADEIQGCSVSGWDAANVRISRDGGTSWSVVRGSPSYTYSSCYGWYHNGETCSVAGWGHSSGGWVDASFDLTLYAGQSIIVRFAFGSDPAESGANNSSLTGLFVDDISVDNPVEGNLLYDDADTAKVMTPAGFAWKDVFHDYGSATRPGGLDWATYGPGDPFNGNTSLNLSEYAGSDVRLRWLVNIDEDHNGGNGEGLFIDDVHVWKKTLRPSYPVPQNVVAQPGDGVVSLSWDPVVTGEGGEIAYDTDDGSGSSFSNGIYSETGTFLAGEYFTTPFGAELDAAKIYGFGQNSRSATTLLAFNAVGGDIDTTATYSKDINLTNNVWNEIDLSSDGWIFDGEFALAIEVGTFPDEESLFVAIDESAVPSEHSYVLFNEWSRWRDVAEANQLPDGEWGIRAVIGESGEIPVEYNVYRRGTGESFERPLPSGTGLEGTVFHDRSVTNGKTYVYAVSVVFNPGTSDEAESNLSKPVEAMPMPEAAYLISYDDGTAETGATSLGEGGNYAVRFTPSDYAARILKVQFYAYNEGGSTQVRFWDDDGEGGMPGSELGAPVTLEAVSAGWNETDVSDSNLVIHEGDLYVGLSETADSPNLGLDQGTDVMGRSLYQAPGESWAPISDLGYAANLMIRVILETTVGIETNHPGQIPETFSLMQNYPNPFNDATVIPFDLPENHHVSLRLYDIRGSLVRTVLDRRLERGSYSIRLTAEHLPSGVYIYRIRTDSGSLSRKLVLMK